MRRTAVFLALGVVLVLGMGAVATGVAITTPTLTASPMALTYPHSARLTVSSDTTPSVIMMRLAGASEWTTLGATIETTRAIRYVKPSSTAAYEVVSDGVTSDPVTITVRAQLSKPQVNGHGRRHHRLTIKGWVAPLHSADATVGLTFFRWEKVSTTVVTVKHGHTTKTKKITKYKWVQHGDQVSVPLARQNSQKSKWSYKWSPSMKGTWKVVVSHQDVAHAYSAASARTVIRR
jgi:hypothetical protein